VRRYVVRKDSKTNAVYVSREYHSKDKLRDRFECDAMNWIGQPPAQVTNGYDADGQQVHVKVRHGPNMFAVQELRVHSGGARATVILPSNDQGLAAGQYAVFYNRGKCLGSGVICSTPDL
jgi:tRNA-5-taurinomethyluridine 2-sulfurtransferase